MSPTSSNSGGVRPPSPFVRGPSGGPPLLLGIVPIALLLGALFFGSVFVWTFCRIEPLHDQFAVLVHKTGRDLPWDQIIATSPDQKGIQLEVLPEGRYFYNPYSWAWEIKPVLDVPAGKLAVLTRLFGKDQPPGAILATKDSKGIVPEVLTPGKYRVNPHAYSWELFDASSIKPGCAGVVTSLAGDDMFSKPLPPEMQNAFLAIPGYKGVMPAIKEPGTYYDLNPYMFSMAEVNLQSQRFEMSGEDAIDFLTMDGFRVHVEGTVEYALIPEQVAKLTHQVGEMDDIVKKLIMPLARGFSRIEGSKNPAKNYITGSTRQLFQNNLESHLKEQCLESGVAIRSVLIRNIVPPDDIASLIREREVAVQNARKFDQQILQAKSQAELTRQEALAVQSKEKVEADTASIRAVIAAKQDMQVRLTAADQELAVAKLEAAAAQAQAGAILLKADAERQVIALSNTASATVIVNQVQAFGGGLNFARHELYEKLAPQIRSILSGDEETGLGGLFRPYVLQLKDQPKEVRP